MNGLPSLCVLLATTTLSAQWRQLAPPVAPSPRSGCGMASDLSGNTFVVGGAVISSLATNPMWRFDGASWVLLPSHPAAARAFAAFVYDSTRNVFVLYGGMLSPGVPAMTHTWEFDGTTWMHTPTNTSPDPLVGHAACFDSLRGRVVMHGGTAVIGLGVPSAKTFEYDGADWQQLVLATGPGPISGAAMCFHAGLAKAVLFGGYDGVTYQMTDTTWLYDGVAWTIAAVTGPRPPLRADARMVYDAARAVCVLVGGNDGLGSPLGDTWEFDGTTWQLQNTSTTAASTFGLAYDLAHNTTVRFGGSSNMPIQVFDETWLYGAGSRSYGSGCAGNNGVPLLAATTTPNLGLTWHLQLSNLVPSIPIAAIVFGLTELPAVPLAGIGMPGCAAFVTPDVLVALPASGTALWATSVPAAPSLLGASLFAQGLSIDPGVNAAGLTVSNAVQGLLGH